MDYEVYGFASTGSAGNVCSRSELLPNWLLFD